MRNLASQKEQQASVQSDSVYDKLRIFNSQSSGWAWYPSGAPPTHLSLPSAASQLNSQLAREDAIKGGTNKKFPKISYFPKSYQALNQKKKETIFFCLPKI